ncbi:hypothetical protein Q5530_12160 [Saccharothrix sp. BKS2]|uniref:hypothetical protein n=1 Tax=Saccharothrix sp. BKS2 TaxID=3064400 RepID=UPI0039EC127D
MTSARSRSAGRVAALVVGVAIVAVVAVVVADRVRGGTRAEGDCADSAVPVTGIIGSEKESLFKDPRVVERLACRGLRVTVDSQGSREMLVALRNEGHGYGFAFPSSTPTAQKILGEFDLHDSFALFSSPMVVATFNGIADTLQRNGAVQADPDGSRVVDVAALLRFAREGRKWEQLEGPAQYRFPKAVELRTTDPQDSSSAIMFLSLASHVANNGSVVQAVDEVRRVVPDLCALVGRQGDKQRTSQDLFNDYLTKGYGRVPIGLVYEAQFLTRSPAPVLPPDAVMLYPRPTVYSRHTLIPFDDAGGQLGRALRDDQELVRLAAEHGFRPESPVAQPVGADRSPTSVVESPSFEVLEAMLDELATIQRSGEGCP